MWSAPLLVTLSGLSFGPAVRPRGLRPAPATALRSATHISCSVPESPDAAIDELIRREVETAFAELDARNGLTEEEEGELDAIIEAKGDLVLRNVLDKLESDGDQLAASLQRQVTSYTKERQVEMLRKFDEDAAKVQLEMAADREAMRAEVTKLSTLQSECGAPPPPPPPPPSPLHTLLLDPLLQSHTRNGSHALIPPDLGRLEALQREGGGGFSKNSVVGGIALLAGLAYLGTAVNEGLRLAFGDDGSVVTFGLNTGFALLGVGYHFYKKAQPSDA